MEKLWPVLSEASENLVKYLSFDEQDYEIADLLDDNRASHGYHFEPYVQSERPEKSPWQPQVRGSGTCVALPPPPSPCGVHDGASVVILFLVRSWRKWWRRAGAAGCSSWPCRAKRWDFFI